MENEINTDLTDGESKKTSQQYNIKRKKWTFRILAVGLMLAAGVLIVMKSGIMASQPPKKKAAAPAMPPTTVEVIEVAVKPSVREIVFVGSLEANESVIIRSEVSGRITDIGFIEGRPIEKNAVLFTLDQSELQAELDKAKADLELHRANYLRAKSLLRTRAISKQAYDETLSQWESDKASIRLIEARLAKTEINAPFDGVLGLRHVSIGDYINAGEDLVNIEDVSRLKVSFKIPEVNAALVKRGQDVRLFTDAAAGKEFEARVYAVNPRMDRQSRSLEVKAVIENPPAELRPGQFVRAALSVGRTEEALFIPEQAVVPQPERMYVWKVVDGRSMMTEVTIGKRINGQVEITKGLAPGDTVITGGIQKIHEGAPVNPVAADPNLFARKGKSHGNASF